MQLLCSFRVFMAARLLIGIALLCSFAYGQQPDSSWQAELRKSAAAQDWTAAMGIVDRELARAPQDIEVRAWRARILTWSGSLAEAEHEYRDIVAAVPNDPDYWMGLGTVYSREGRTQDAVQCLKRAVELDPHRADLRSAYGRVLRDAHSRTEAKSQFQQAVQLDPTSAEARAGLLSLRSEPRHELRVGTDTDFFNFTDANHDEGIALTSDWSSRWKTGLAWDSYQRGGTLAEKFTGSITAKLRDHGALTVGGTTARDNGVVPQCEAFFNYDRGWARKREHFLQGLEIVYGQHWYWYTTARIFTLNGNAIFYLPHDWTWSLAINEAQSNFYGAGTEWRPAGATRLAFPIVGGEAGRLKGNVFFGVGTETFAQVDQLGRFSSHTFGAGLRLRLSPIQDLMATTAYQMRSHDHTQTSIAFTYAVHF
jgi:tetratricopeptide (TPR) repeat protein